MTTNTELVAAALRTASDLRKWRERTPELSYPYYGTLIRALEDASLMVDELASRVSVLADLERQGYSLAAQSTWQAERAEMVAFIDDVTACLESQQRQSLAYPERHLWDPEPLIRRARALVGREGE